MAGRPILAALPSTRTINAYVEPTEAGPTKAARISRPGLTPWNTVGLGPILRTYQNPGIFNGDPFFVSQGQFYRSTSLLGSVPFSNQPRMAATITQLALVVAGALYGYDGTTFAQVQFFDDQRLLPAFSTGVAVLTNIFVFPVAGTTEYFWSKAGDATSINALNFASATTTPDPIAEVCVLSDELYFLKQANGTEIWDYNPITDPTTGQITQPFQLSQGRTWIRGTPAQGSVVPKIDNAIIWVGDDLEVYRSGFVPEKISTPMIDDRLRAAKDTIGETTAFGLGIEGHWLYVMNLPGIGESYAYDCATKLWAQWGTRTDPFARPWHVHWRLCSGSGRDDLRQRCTVQQPASTCWMWRATSTGRSRGRSLSRRRHLGAARHKRLNNVSLACVQGVGTNTDNPLVYMRLSNDGGRTFTTWMQGNLGLAGQYTFKAVWRNLGVIQQPGVLMEFAVWADYPVTIEGGAWNIARA